MVGDSTGNQYSRNNIPKNSRGPFGSRPEINFERTKSANPRHSSHDSKSCDGSSWNTGMIADSHSANPGDLINFMVSGPEYDGSMIEFFFASDVSGSSLNNMYIKSKKQNLIRLSTSKLHIPAEKNRSCILSPWKEKPSWEIVANVTVPQNWSGELVVARLAPNDTDVYATRYWYLTVRHKLKYENNNPSAQNNPPEIAVMYNLFTNDVAYNGFGGYSFYSRPFDSNNGMIFSLYRPTGDNSQSAGNLQIYSWIKKKGITDYQAFNDLDLNFRCHEISMSKLWILTSHPEYWTLKQKKCLEEYLDSGGRMIYLAANGIYRRVEFDEVTKDTIQYQLNGTFTIRGHEGEKGGEWENIAEKSNHPAKLTGGIFDSTLLCAGGAYKIEIPDHWAFMEARKLLSDDLYGKGLQFAGTVVPPENYGCIEVHSLSNSDQIKLGNLITPLGAAGWEVDSITEESPEEYDLIGTSTQTKDQSKGAILMYFRRGKGCVFSSNSMVSPWGLHNDIIFSGMVEGIINTMINDCPDIKDKTPWGLWVLLGVCLLFMSIGFVILIKIIR